MRIIAHVDMAAFYAAVEERYHPELRGRPVVVGADPKGGKGRGVVTAASYAARKYGIRSALPISRAWRLAEAARRRGEPEAVFVRGDRSLYREVSDRIMTIIAQGADAFEEASIDEAYVDLSSLGEMERGAAQRLVRKVRRGAVPEGARTLRRSRVERVGAQVGGGAGDLRGGHARLRLHPGARPGACRRSVSAVRQRGLSGIPNGDGDGSL